MHKWFLFLLLLESSFGLRAQPSGYTPIKDLAKFKEQFAAIAKKTETIKSDFSQDKNLSMLSEKIVSKGKFWFKKPDLLRMEYEKPYEYLMVLNKDNMVIRDGKKINRINIRSNKVFQQINKITVDCVQGTVLNNPDFVTKVYETDHTYLIELAPVAKALKEFFKNIEVIIDKKEYAVSTIIMNEQSGDNTTLHFIDREFNTSLPYALFVVK